MTVTKEQADALRAELDRLGKVPPRGVSYARWLEDAVDRNKLSLRIIDVAPELLAEKTVEALATKAVQDAQREVTNARGAVKFVEDSLVSERSAHAQTKAELASLKAKVDEVYAQAVSARNEGRRAANEADTLRADVVDHSQRREQAEAEKAAAKAAKQVADEALAAEKDARKLVEDDLDVERAQKLVAESLVTSTTEALALASVEKEAAKRERDQVALLADGFESARDTALTERNAERAAKIAALGELDVVKADRAAKVQLIEAQAAEIEALKAERDAEKLLRKDAEGALAAEKAKHP